MHLISFCELYFDGVAVKYKLYGYPSGDRYHFKPEATISIYPTYIVSRLERQWTVETKAPLHIQKQLVEQIQLSRKQRGPALL